MVLWINLGLLEAAIVDATTTMTTVTTSKFTL
jgi:hypothetical protein